MKRLRLRLDELIKEHEIERGKPITQIEIAEAANIPPGTLSRYVNGYLRRYDHEILEKLLNYFDCDITDLIAVEEE